MKIVLVGARSARQGTGPFIAAALSAAGASIDGVVGTSADSVEQARQSLSAQWGIDANGYTDLTAAIAAEGPDAVVICSPWQFHLQQLALVAQAGCHCLVEKPLAWPATPAEVDQVVSAYEQRGLLLQLVTQWPLTLPSFRTLHRATPTPIEQFAMGLSPISIGPTMVPDSAPHFVSMLQALLGPGECERVELELSTCGNDDQPRRLELACDYRHASGLARARLVLQTCEQRPRPAWYQINGQRADREVDLPSYQQYFVAAGGRVALPDPMQLVAANFVHALAAGAGTDGATLRQGHHNLRQLAAAWPGEG